MNNVFKYILEIVLFLTDLIMFGFFVKQFMCLKNFTFHKIKNGQMRDELKSLSFFVMNGIVLILMVFYLFRLVVRDIMHPMFTCTMMFGKDLLQNSNLMEFFFYQITVCNIFSFIWAFSFLSFYYQILI